MKRIITLLLIVAGVQCSIAQTATNFTCNDCSGTSHDLFTELDAGKVIVLIWVMPCGACTAPSQTAYNTVTTYQSSHPNRVFLYMADDIANSACSFVDGWANSISVPQNAHSFRFSNADIDMNDYGSQGMPKIVVLGGTTHTVFYNVNNSVNATALQNAIDAALSSTGLQEQASLFSGLSVYPNPSNDKAVVEFTLAKSSEVDMQLFNMEGKLLQQLHSGRMNQGVNNKIINTARLSAGMYLIKLTSNNNSRFINLLVTH